MCALIKDKARLYHYDKELLLEYSFFISFETSLDLTASSIKYLFFPSLKAVFLQQEKTCNLEELSSFFVLRRYFNIGNLF